MGNLKFHSKNFIPNGVKHSQSLTEKEHAKFRDNLLFTALSFIVLCFALVIVLLCTFVIFIADVDGASMYPTLHHGDKLVTNRYKEPKVGSIITLRQQKANGEYELWIKRVIAMESGDVVEIKNGSVYVNGQIKLENYLPKSTTTTPSNETVKWVLGEDEIFFLGDNRGNSKDARAVGPCKKSDVVGVVSDWSVWLVGLFR